MSADALDILDFNRPSTSENSSWVNFKDAGKIEKKPIGTSSIPKRPAGMRRELYYLFNSDNGDELPTLLPTDLGFKKEKAKLGLRHTAKWRWVLFQNSAREDGVLFHHWEKIDPDSKETKVYPFSKFDTKVPIHTYTDEEYAVYFQSGKWSKEETDHLFDLAQRFDLRFIVMHDRWDRAQFGNERSIEEMKERYYEISGILNNIRTGASPYVKRYVYDADHERKRKDQLERLYARPPELLEEIEMLSKQLVHIENNRMVREKKQQALQRLIGAYNGPPKNKIRNTTKKSAWKKLICKPINPINESSTGIKFRNFHVCNLFVRSSTMRLPTNMGQKKKEYIDSRMRELDLISDSEPKLVATEEICTNFNELRSEVALVYELRKAAYALDVELLELKHQYQALCPDKNIDVNDPDSETVEIIDVVGDDCDVPQCSFQFQL